MAIQSASASGASHTVCLWRLSYSMPLPMPLQALMEYGYGRHVAALIEYGYGRHVAALIEYGYGRHVAALMEYGYVAMASYGYTTCRGSM